MQMLRAQNIALTSKEKNITLGMIFRDVHSIQKQNLRLEFI
jgi:hypothetical protein